MKLLGDVGAAMTAALDDQRRTDLCRLHGIARAVVDLFGPTTRACFADVHEVCDGEWRMLGATGPCLCSCHTRPVRSEVVA